MTQDYADLAATGSDVTPWLIVAGIIVLLGVIALVVAGVIRSRRAVGDVAATTEAPTEAQADASESGTAQQEAPAAPETGPGTSTSLGAGSDASTSSDAGPDTPASPDAGPDAPDDTTPKP